MDTKATVLTIGRADGVVEKRLSQDPRHVDFMLSHDNCVLCGERLILRHQAEPLVNIICEEAFCNSCGTQNRNQAYKVS